MMAQGDPAAGKLGEIPKELLQEIKTHLAHDDLTHLSETCRALKAEFDAEMNKPEKKEFPADKWEKQKKKLEALEKLVHEEIHRLDGVAKWADHLPKYTPGTMGRFAKNEVDACVQQLEHKKGLLESSFEEVKHMILKLRDRKILSHEQFAALDKFNQDFTAAKATFVKHVDTATHAILGKGW